MKKSSQKSNNYLYRGGIIAGLVLVLLVYFFSCGDNSYDKFCTAMAAGELSEAQVYLTKIDDRNNCRTAALQLVNAYIEVGEVKKAIHVYETITSWHKDRYDMKRDPNGYESKVCHALRKALVKNGDYETAWNYYPLDYQNENYLGNAHSRYAYISDVVENLCQKGMFDEARRFVDRQIRWFVTYIDLDTTGFEPEVKTQFNSSTTKDLLLSQIDHYNAYQ